MSAKMVEQLTPRAHSSTETPESNAKAVKINFVRTLKKNQRFIAIKCILYQGGEKATLKW